MIASPILVLVPPSTMEIDTHTAARLFEERRYLVEQYGLDTTNWFRPPGKFREKTIFHPSEMGGISPRARASAELISGLAETKRIEPPDR